MDMLVKKREETENKITYARTAIHAERERKRRVPALFWREVRW